MDYTMIDHKKCEMFNKLWVGNDGSYPGVGGGMGK